jgi:DNA-binding MarR family transcriptional regulator
MFLKLTKKGQEMVDEIKKSHRKKICNLVEFLGEKESKKLISLMTKLNDFIEKNN